ncbi:MAG: ankyrin repeat domain-containing protein [Gammaproteobacteria bacterium]|nr:ankyrin repeat domain-containing protein [Gammaproteobacteria bacterium]
MLHKNLSDVKASSIHRCTYMQLSLMIKQLSFYARKTEITSPITLAFQTFDQKKFSITYFAETNRWRCSYAEQSLYFKEDELTKNIFSWFHIAASTPIADAILSFKMELTVNKKEMSSLLPWIASSSVQSTYLSPLVQSVFLLSEEREKIASHVNFLNQCIKDENIDAIHDFLRSDDFNPIILNAIDHKGYTPLRAAVEMGLPKVVNAFIQHGANLEWAVPIPTGFRDSNFNYHIEDLLSVAIAHQQIDCIRLLIEQGVDPHKKNSRGISPYKAFTYYADQNNQRNAEIEALLYHEIESIAPTKFCPRGQEWIIEQMKALGYRAQSDGFCSGVEALGRPLLLTENTHPEHLVNFNERTFILSTIPPALLAGQIERAQKKVTAEINAIWQSLYIQGYNPWGHNVKEMFQKKFEQYLTLTSPNPDSHLLTREERLLLDVKPWFDGLSCAQELYLYKPIDQVRKKKKQATKAFVSDLLMPESLKELGGEKLVARFSGSYSHKELNRYFQSFREAMKDKFEHPIALRIRNYDHVINIQYNPTKDTWLYLDANHLPIQTLKTIHDITFRTYDAFCKEKENVILGTDIFIARDPLQTNDINAQKLNEEKFNTHFHNWQKSKSYKEIHCVTREKAKTKDAGGSTWLMMAAASGEVEVTRQLAQWTPGSKGTTNAFRVLGFAILCLGGLLFLGSPPVGLALLAFGTVMLCSADMIAKKIQSGAQIIQAKKKKAHQDLLNHEAIPEKSAAGLGQRGNAQKFKSSTGICFQVTGTTSFNPLTELSNTERNQDNYNHLPQIPQTINNSDGDKKISRAPSAQF